MAMLCRKSIKAQSSSSLKSKLGGNIKKKKTNQHLKWKNKSLLNLSEKSTVATQCRHNTVQQASSAAERGSELCRRDPHPGYLKCSWVLCTICPGILQSWGKLRGRQVLRKGLCFHWSGVELLKGPQFGGIQASQKERETGANTQWKRRHEWQHGKAMASSCTAHRMGRGGTTSPHTHCYTTAVSRKVTSGVRKGCGTHPSLSDDFID